MGVRLWGGRGAVGGLGGMRDGGGEGGEEKDGYLLWIWEWWGDLRL